MRVYRYGEANLKTEPDASVSIGSYDGVHRGHHELLRRLREGQVPTVVTFDPHPQTVLRRGPGPIRVLTPLPEKLRKLEALGVERTVVVPFTEETARIEAEDFLRQILVEAVGMKRLVVGFDHSFGRDRKGDIEFMSARAEQYGYELVVVEPFGEQEAISSTRIRQAISEGKMALAASMLGEPYRVTGTVVPGDGRGRELGFPTANLAPVDKTQLVPAEGVYAVRLGIGDGLHFPGVCSIGRKETFGDDIDLAIEVHLFDADIDLYGRNVWVQWIEHLRGQVAYGSAEELIAQIELDCEQARHVLDYGA